MAHISKLTKRVNKTLTLTEKKFQEYEEEIIKEKKRQIQEVGSGLLENFATWVFLLEASFSFQNICESIFLTFPFIFLSAQLSQYSSIHSHDILGPEEQDPCL
jgi:hypothetical protein